MKRFLIVFLCIVMVITAFASCDINYDNYGNGEDSDKNPSQNSGESSLYETPFSSGSAKESTPHVSTPHVSTPHVSTPPESTPPESTPSESTPLESSAPEIVESEIPETDKIGNLHPDIDLQEKEIVILSRGLSAYADEVCVENSKGVPLDEAVIKRQNNVEKTLNCKIKNIKLSETGISDYAVINEIIKTKGPDCQYDIVAAPAYTAFDKTAADVCINLKDTANLDLTQDYWIPYFNEEASIGNAQYFATGSISLSLRRMVFVTFFNEDMAKKRNFEDLYTVVNEGRWTLDYQAELLSNTWSEVDGEVGNTEGDFYGLVTNSHICVDPYWSACDVDILVKDRDDFFVLAPDTVKFDAILNKIGTLYDNSRTYVFKGSINNIDQEKIRSKLVNEEAIMATLRLIEVESSDLRNMDNYGILPIPKFDANQKKYYSLAQDIFMVYGIINKESSNFDDLSAVLECMAIESEREITPVYYEMALNSKYSDDPQSWDMLDMIVKNIKIDGGLIYTLNLNDITQMLRNTVMNNSYNSYTVFNAVKLQVLTSKLARMQSDIKNMQNS